MLLFWLFFYTPQKCLMVFTKIWSSTAVFKIDNNNNNKYIYIITINIIVKIHIIYICTHTHTLLLFFIIFLAHQISILEWFLKDDVTLKTGDFKKVYYNRTSLFCNNIFRGDPKVTIRCFDRRSLIWIFPEMLWSWHFGNMGVLKCLISHRTTVFPPQ